MEKERMRTIVLLMGIGAALFAAALHVEKIGGLLVRVWGMILPVVIGAVMAFVLNVPMRGFEGLFARLNRKKQQAGQCDLRQISFRAVCGSVHCRDSVIYRVYRFSASLCEPDRCARGSAVVYTVYRIMDRLRGRSAADLHHQSVEGCPVRGCV